MGRYEKWNDFNNFFMWAITNGYSDELTIDRKDVDKGYYSENCRWATKSMQNHNQRSKKHSTPFRGIWYSKKKREYETEEFGSRKKLRENNK